ncbi:hypothetical protein [Burkholderia sp. Ac-20365]|uniref:hypothetical protein n=1 Tax=Burkholderia sp. Ac-20365 TaxID=2703897 RepID=UPI00197C3F7B|nr:hypothetical protein [Burkholderia sp. Ac-20365]MBN3760752.1 hypothetical protein [Burkholderia sp. Ac-20365]
MNTRYVFRRLIAILPVFLAGLSIAFSRAASSAPAFASASSATEASGAPSMIVADLARALAWPLTALAIAVIFRTPLSQFVSAIGGRVNKLSAFKIEVELASASAPTYAPLLDYIRTGTSIAPLADSSSTLIDQLKSTEPADFAVIYIGDGKQWITSRLFLASVMMERMRSVKVFVFVERAAQTDRHFVAVISVRELRWLLAMRYPWLQVALVKAEADTLQYDDPATSDVKRITTNTGAIETYSAQQLADNFMKAIQRPIQDDAEQGIVGAAAVPPRGWTKLETYEERARWVTRAFLTSFLPSDAFEAAAKIPSEYSRARRARALLRCRAPFVALIDDDRRFVRLVNRLAYLEEVAAALGEEPDSGSG